jgi:uncharacterized protein YjbI with pentapeptide repeats
MGTRLTINPYPGEPLHRAFARVALVGLTRSAAFSGVPDEVAGRQESWFSNQLIVTDQDLAHTERRDAVHRSFRGRDLEGAILNRSDLSGADFTGAHLKGAQLSHAILKDVHFGCLDTTNIDTSGEAEALAFQTGCVDLRNVRYQGQLNTQNQVSASSCKSQISNFFRVRPSTDMPFSIRESVE